MVEIGGQQCLLSVSNDITERRRAEEEVRLLQAITMDVAVAQDLLNCSRSSAAESRAKRPDGYSGKPGFRGRTELLVDCSSAWFSSAGGAGRIPSGFS